MKAIRRSLKGDRDSKPHHVSITPKSAIAILPPKKVIKALYDYEPDAGNIQELAFNKGDFFHVLSREDDPDWYEACNPLVPNARGLVPVSFFEVVHKNEKDRHSGGSKDSLTQDLYDSGFSERSVHNDRRDSTNTNKQAALRMSAIGKGSGAMVYGIVQYDFHAERPDELEAKAGEAIIVIAQSNPEWFVAKPIRRLGGPGLIPVSFIEIKDMRTGETVADPLDAVRRAGVPRVEEWKKMTAEYKNSSISLGKLESSGASGMQPVSNGMEKMSMSSNGGGYRPQAGNELGYQSRSESRVGTYSQSGHPQQQYYPQPTQPDPNYRVAPVSASIPRYCFDNDKYWYVIEAKMEDGTIWELSRYYHDFYDFQIALLSQFEEEAGNGGRTRTLPYMPGPVTHVTDAISNGRRQNLDDYIKKLLAMPPHISRCPLVCQLFTPRPGDFEIDPNAVGDPYRLSNESQQSSGHNVSMSDSRQSSQAHMSASAAVYPSANGPPARAPHQRQQSSLSQQNSAASQSRTELQPPAMNRQASSLTQTSNASSTNAITVKVTFEDDTIAFLVPSDINFNQLLEKLRDRLKVTGNIRVNYRENLSRKDEGTPMTSDQNLDEALRLNPKLSLVVKRI
ncbi:hypothetical protein BGW36DRAFT_389528 [Talaromyces proteolyticus]|uniref:Protein kinase activator Bem1 n=1 Tax=Talaromyces proteolyticus TaxID=1131652 RepID=A0AAD4KLK7_9EURO|nr:uncharacterized protein BGW36DRAFT_389528 [Talaromyces proteolyticus]KAH8690886.1 hypothetical protein BGW36DRAFT_389528 [Talaromyces proteolyticus]